ncbi:hypothetical protein FRX31_014058 [Thalictrum thalictroides]|uniref:Uncharacterized protein n=1 Tax=Thalictrum thalictroides TaxID=46969 RepID=A0A7J6WFY8_THATH|nr:hypothetical protein FRX31_014058 [Thalictrum thalictroides]
MGNLKAKDDENNSKEINEDIDKKLQSIMEIAKIIYAANERDISGYLPENPGSEKGDYEESFTSENEIDNVDVDAEGDDISDCDCEDNDVASLDNADNDDELVEVPPPKKKASKKLAKKAETTKKSIDL